MFAIIFSFLLGITILTVEILSIITTNFYNFGYGFISIFLHTMFISFGLICIIAAIKDYIKLKKDK